MGLHGAGEGLLLGLPVGSLPLGDKDRDGLPSGSQQAGETEPYGVAAGLRGSSRGVDHGRRLVARPSTSVCGRSVQSGSRSPSPSRSQSVSQSLSASAAPATTATGLAGESGPAATGGTGECAGAYEEEGEEVQLVEDVEVVDLRHGSSTSEDSYVNTNCAPAQDVAAGGRAPTPCTADAPGAGLAHGRDAVGLSSERRGAGAAGASTVADAALPVQRPRGKPPRPQPSPLKGDKAQATGGGHTVGARAASAPRGAASDSCAAAESAADGGEDNDGQGPWDGASGARRPPGTPEPGRDDCITSPTIAGAGAAPRRHVGKPTALEPQVSVAADSGQHDGEGATAGLGGSGERDGDGGRRPSGGGGAGLGGVTDSRGVTPGASASWCRDEGEGDATEQGGEGPAETDVDGESDTAGVSPAPTATEADAQPGLLPRAGRGVGRGGRGGGRGRGRGRGRRGGASGRGTTAAGVKRRSSMGNDGVVPQMGEEGACAGQLADPTLAWAPGGKEKVGVSYGCCQLAY